MGGLTQNFFFIVLEAGHLRSGSQHSQGLVRALFLTSRGCLLTVLTWWKEDSFLGSLLIRALMSSWGPHPPLNLKAPSPNTTTLGGGVVEVIHICSGNTIQPIAKRIQTPFASFFPLFLECCLALLAFEYKQGHPKAQVIVTACGILASKFSSAWAVPH